MKTLYKYVLTTIFLCANNISFAQADTNTAIKFGEYTVHYSIFNSTFITPKIAEIHKITRASNQSLLNISLTKTTEADTSLGLAAKVTGSVKNLIQQQRTLNFSEIKEPTATYYIAPVRHTNEEIMHFIVAVTPADTEKTFTLKFDKKLYTAQP